MLLLIFRKRDKGRGKREREREKERNIYYSIYICIHWLLFACTLKGDLIYNIGVLRWHSDQPEPNKILFKFQTFFVDLNKLLLILILQFSLLDLKSMIFFL